MNTLDTGIKVIFLIFFSPEIQNFPLFICQAVGKALTGIKSTSETEVLSLRAGIQLNQIGQTE